MQSFGWPALLFYEPGRRIRESWVAKTTARHGRSLCKKERSHDGNPGRLTAADETASILHTIKAFKFHDLTEGEAKSDLVKRFDGHPDEDLCRRLKVYIDRMLRQVRTDEVDAATAASDIQAMIAAVLSGDPDAACLAELGPE